MAEIVTLEFLGAQMERMIADQAAMRDDIRVLTAIALRHENTLDAIRQEMRDMLGQMTAIGSMTACTGSKSAQPRRSRPCTG